MRAPRLPLLAVSLFAVASGLVLAGSDSADPPLILRVHVADRDADLPRLAAMDLDVAGVDVKKSTADFVGDRATYDALVAAGFFPEIVPRPVTTEALSQYLDPVEVSQKVNLYATTYPALAKKVAVATTSEGRAEWALKISDNVNLDEDEPAVLFVAQHHAREVMTTEIAFDIADYLLTRYATDARVRAWVDEREIWVIPTHNPDGTNTVFTTNSSWRKNRRVNGGGSFGVDPNRNYPRFWSFCASGGGASPSTSSDTYRGPSAGSEPETQGLMQLAQAQRPVVSLSYHTYSELVIQPYGCVELVLGENRLFRDHSSDMASRLRNDDNDGWYSSGTAWELLYEVSGESDEWLYGELGIVTTTVEANSSAQGFQPDYNTWRDQTVLRNRPGWQYLLDRIDGPSIVGHVTDACTGAPLSATIGLDEIVFSSGEAPRTSEPLFGRYQRLTVPGSYHLRASAAGYATQVWPQDVAFRAVDRDVRLVPTGSFAAAVGPGAVDDGAGDGDGQLDPGETVGLGITAYATGGALHALTAVLSTSDPYVTILDANGSWPTISAGGLAPTSDKFAFSLSPTAPDEHVIVFTLSFSASEALCAPSSTFEARVSTHAPDCPAISDSLDTNPGWTIQNTDASGWAFGVPYSGAVSGPTAAHSGARVYGTNLTGAYGNLADYRLVTTSFDLTGLRHAELRFWRWLSNEAGYDIASVDVSTNGTDFTNVWSGFGRDTSWELYRLDVSSLADGQPTVYVRFRLQSDGSTTKAGFYIDDVSICGESAVAAPRLAVGPWGASDTGNPSCGDGDVYADGGEAVDLSVTVRNDGTAPATDTVALLSSTDSRIGMATFRAPLGTLAAGASALASFRITIPGDYPCGATAPLRVDVLSNGGAFTAFDAGLGLPAVGDAGTPVPDTFENFESASGWTLTGEWQIGTPMGRGGTASGGQGSPDPGAAVSGVRVLGVDLTGMGTQVGSYENSVTTAITATSPTWSCAASTHVELRFRRWLGVERSLYDKATVDAWNGAAWQTVWQNPDTTTSDSSWQQVVYDVTPWAAGNAAFRVRFKITSDGALAYCGWNVDDLTITNGTTPRVCETAPCAAGCTPATEISGLVASTVGSVTVLDWAPGGDPCQAAAGASYRVYRATDPRPQAVPPSLWPQDSAFVDVTALDQDGTSANASFTEVQTPAAGSVFYYLVVPMGTSGLEGPKGWQGL